MNDLWSAIFLWAFAIFVGGEAPWLSGFLTACGFAVMMRDT